ncbi:MAG: sugar transferase [Thermodesulfobacteriota bacterium]|nr:sugar transferase [Thermodesulfobacteriota bacterium]
MATFRKNRKELTLWNRCLKRSFDVSLSLVGMSFTSWIILAAYVLASLETKSNGFFIQKRIGRNGRIFHFVKIRTMRNCNASNTTVTTSKDPRVTRLGRILRKTKIDELPQLIHVFFGQMSLVGPRPDVPGFADKLGGSDRVILTIRPGITGPATLKYRNEEDLLSSVQDPERYNEEVLFPDKVRLNREYVESYRFLNDIEYVFRTLAPKWGSSNAR